MVSALWYRQHDGGVGCHQLAVGGVRVVVGRFAEQPSAVCNPRSSKFGREVDALHEAALERAQAH